MAGNLGKERRRWILNLWKYEITETVRKVCENEFNVPAPSRLTIYRIGDKFGTSSVVNAPKSGRPRTTLTQENEMKIALTFVNSPKKSTRPSRELGITRKSLQRLMH